MKKAIINKKYDHLFDTEQLKGQLKSKAVRGGFNIMTAQVVSILLRIGSMIILARILMPEHFGLIGMVTAVTGIAEKFKDLGLSTATVQRKVISHDQVSALFWVNVGFGTLLMFIIAVFSWAIGWFFAEQRLVVITLALSSSFLFGGLTVQHQALLQRQMRFGELAWIKIFSETLSVVIGIGLACWGFEYWSLVWKEISRNAFYVAGVWFFCPWRPSAPSKAEGLESMLRFGGGITGFRIVSFFSLSLDQILIGKYWGAVPLGFYRQAHGMITAPLSQFLGPFYAVSEPTLSTLQNDPQRYSKYYEKIVSLLSFVSMPMVMYLAIFSDTIVRVLLGEKWIDSAGIFRALAVGAFIGVASSTSGIVMVTSGKARRYFWFGVLQSIVIVASFILGVPWGPIGVATAYSISIYLTLFPGLWYAFRDTPVSIRIFLRAVFRPIFCTILMSLFLILCSPGFSKLGGLEIPFSLVLGFFFFCGIWLLFPGGKETLKEYFSYPFLALRLHPNIK